MQHKVELSIVSRYALATLILFALMVVYYLIRQQHADVSLLVLELQAYSFAILGVVILTSVAGFFFHQGKAQQRQRNGFGVVMISGLLKLAATVLVYHFVV